MVAAEHKPGKKCTYLSCGKLAGFAVRAAGESTWEYACGYHTGRVIKGAERDGHGVRVDVLGS